MDGVGQLKGVAPINVLINHSCGVNVERNKDHLNYEYKNKATKRIQRNQLFKRRIKI